MNKIVSIKVAVMKKIFYNSITEYAIKQVPIGFLA